MSDLEREYYNYSEFRQQMAEVTATLKQMNKAANYMRWQYPMDDAFKDFQSEINEAAYGWLSSWCE